MTRHERQRREALAVHAAGVLVVLLCLGGIIAVGLVLTDGVWFQ